MIYHEKVGNCILYCVDVHHVRSVDLGLYRGVCVMNRYLVKLQRYKNGKAGTTKYRFVDRRKGIAFAAGYQAALHDVGKTDLYVSVYETDIGIPAKPFHKSEEIANSDELKAIAEREY